MTDFIAIQFKTIKSMPVTKRKPMKMEFQILAVKFSYALT